METIHGYVLETPLTNKGAGTCQWGFCKKNSRTYFIKKFLDPVYPVSAGELSEKLIQRKRRACEEFYARKSEFYRVLNHCRTGNNIIIQDFFREGPNYYVVTDMVYSDGCDSKTISSLPDDRKTTVICSVLYSIAALHERGIVHADIKPDNILPKKTCSGYYTAKIIDFDAGFLVNQVPPPDEFQFDPAYMAPEVLLYTNGEEATVNEKADIFALGILFHEYWVGERPKFEAGYHYICEAVLGGSKIRLDSKIPAEYRAILRQMLEKDPAARPSARAIQDRILSGKSPDTPPGAESGRGSRLKGRLSVPCDDDLN